MLEFKEIDRQEIRVYRSENNCLTFIGGIHNAPGKPKGFIICTAHTQHLTIAEMKEIVAKSVDI